MAGVPRPTSEPGKNTPGKPENAKQPEPAKTTAPAKPEPAKTEEPKLRLGVFGARATAEGLIRAGNEKAHGWRSVGFALP